MDAIRYYLRGMCAVEMQHVDAKLTVEVRDNAPAIRYADAKEILLVRVIQTMFVDAIVRVCVIL